VALEALFGAGAGDDVLAVAPAELRAEAAVFVPELLEAFVEPADLLADGRVVPLRKALPQLDPLLAQLVDLVMDLVQVHVHFQTYGPKALFPRAAEIPREDGEAGDAARRRERVEEAGHP
jgi:hypothetical protein